MSDRLLKESDVLKAIDRRIEELSKDPVFVRKNGYIDVAGVKKYILVIPSVERPQGEWILQDNQHHIEKIYLCSNCENFEAWGESEKYNYCPNCGAKMRKGVDNDSNSE